MSHVYGWVSLEEADAYMSTRLGAVDIWASGVKEAALITAYNDIVSDGRWDLALASGEDCPDPWKMAQLEQALFLLADPDMEARLSVQVQGVASAGVVNESYRPCAHGMPIAPRALAVMRDFVRDDYHSLNWG